jgi:hypothetical protein
MAIDAALGRLGIRPGVCTSSTRPANPFEGQVIYETDTNNIRFWSGSAWESNKGGIVSSSAPTGAAAGDIWYDSDDGRAYIYYDDGSSQQWVEFGAAPSGSSITLASYADSAARTTAIPSPTEADLSYLQDTNSVEVYDGSAWASVAPSRGLIFITSTSASAVTSVSIDGCFTADYDNYLVVMKGTAASSLTHEVRLQYRASASTETGNVYDNNILYLNTGGAASGVRYTSNHHTFSAVTTVGPTDGYAYIFRPFVSGATTGLIGQGAGTTGNSVHQNGNNTSSTTQYDGFNVYHATGGTFTADFYVYGMVTS